MSFFKSYKKSKRKIDKKIFFSYVTVEFAIVDFKTKSVTKGVYYGSMPMITFNQGAN